MRFRVSYAVSRGNSLENEEYVDEELASLRHQSIDVADRDHDRERDCGWFVVPFLEQVVWLQRHYAKGSPYMRIASVAVVIEPEEVVDGSLAVCLLLKRIRFVWEALALADRDQVCLRYQENDAQLASDVAALMAYTCRIEPTLLPAARGNEWAAADRPYRGSLVGRGTAGGSGKPVAAPADLPADVRGMRRLIESLRSDPHGRITLRYPDGEYDVARAVAAWVADATGVSVWPERI